MEKVAKNFREKAMMGNYLKYGFVEKKATKSELSELSKVEDRLGVSIPDDYRDYITNYKGHEIFINDQSVILWDIKELYETNHDYFIFEDLPNVLSIGSNGGGECIAIDFTSGKVVIFPFIGMSREDFISIGNSFSDFLSQLEQGKKWFD